MKTKMDEAYRDINGRILTGTLIFTDDAVKNNEILEEAFLLVNITKGDLLSQDIELPGSREYLVYLLQSKSGVKLGLCPNVKIWFNTSGVQYRCQHGDRLIPVHCGGNLYRCTIPSNKPKL